MIIITTGSESSMNVCLLICTMLRYVLEGRAHIQDEDVFLGAIKNVTHCSFGFQIMINVGYLMNNLHIKCLMKSMHAKC